jgi:hypothetical protein
VYSIDSLKLNLDTQLCFCSCPLSGNSGPPYCSLVHKALNCVRFHNAAECPGQRHISHPLTGAERASPTRSSAQRKSGGPISRLTTMMAAMYVWKWPPQPGKRAPARRASPSATPAYKEVAGKRGEGRRRCVCALSVSDATAITRASNAPAIQALNRHSISVAACQHLKATANNLRRGLRGSRSNLTAVREPCWPPLPSDCAAPA